MIHIENIIPGKTLLTDIESMFGKPDSITNGSPMTIGNLHLPGNYRILHYDTAGVDVIYNLPSDATSILVVDGVRVRAPYSKKIFGGLSIGQSLHDARCFIKDQFSIKDEYDDAIYFTFYDNPHLYADIENWDTNSVVQIELSLARELTIKR